MTIQDLQEEITLLGDGNAVTNMSLFVTCLNRAMRRLFTDRRIEKSVRIAARSLTPISYYKKIECKSGSATEIPLNGVSYSMRVHGTGNYVVKDDGETRTYSFTSKNETKLVKGFVGTGGKITFYGSFSFTIYDLAIYDQIYSQYTEDIPDYGPRTIFNMRDLYSDFMCFSSPATDTSGNPIDKCMLYDGKVEVDSSYRGEIMLTYRRLPTPLSDVDEDAVIDIPPEYEHLLSSLVAAYYWYYIDEGLAKYYLGQYEENIQSLKENCYDRINLGYVNTNGWA